MQVGLVEHIRVHVADEQVAYEARTDKVKDLRGVVIVERRIDRIVVDARKLRLIIGPVGCVEVICGVITRFLAADFNGKVPGSESLSVRRPGFWKLSNAKTQESGRSPPIEWPLAVH
jgi:hypothetical protein